MGGFEFEKSTVETPSLYKFPRRETYYIGVHPKQELGGKQSSRRLAARRPTRPPPTRGGGRQEQKHQTTHIIISLGPKCVVIMGAVKSCAAKTEQLTINSITTHKNYLDVDCHQRNFLGPFIPLIT